MLNESWFRFGLPLGSAILVAGILEVAMNLLMAWKDLGFTIVLLLENYIKFDPRTIIWILVVVVTNFSSLGLLWGGVIINGKASLLIAWIVTTIISTIIALISWIYGLWGHYWNYFLVVSELYSMALFLFTTGYTLNVAFMCLKPLRAGESIEPIGKGVNHLCNFCINDPTLAGKSALVSELIIIGEYVFTRQITQITFGRGKSGHEGDFSAGIIAEEYVIRLLRFILSSVGVYLISKGKVHQLRCWGVAYFALILASGLTLIYLLFVWSAGHAFFTLGYYITFFLSLVYRCGILYVCMKALNPYTNSSTAYTSQEKDKLCENPAQKSSEIVSLNYTRE